MRRALLATAAIGVGVLALAGPAAPANAADGCANADLRTGPSALLPDCRAYEQVSPPDKDAYTLMLENSSSFSSFDGRRMYFTAITPFGSPLNGHTAAYIATRTDDGWQTENRTTEFCTTDQSGLMNGFPLGGLSFDFSQMYVWDYATSNCDPDDHGGQDLYRYLPEGGLEWVSRNDQPRPATSTSQRDAYAIDGDGSHVWFRAVESLEPGKEAGRRPGTNGLFLRRDGRTTAAAVHDDGTSAAPCGVVPPTLRASSVDGRVVAFAAMSSTTVGCREVDGVGGLFVRIDDQRTIEVSRSQLPVPETLRAASLRDLSLDGRRVLFTTRERLTPAGTVNGGLYEYDLGPVLDGTATEGTLRQLTPASTTAAGGVNTVAVSNDGSRVYASSGAVLVPGAPAAGTKLYRLEAGTTTLVGPVAGAVSVSPDGSKVSYLANPAGSSTPEAHLFDVDDPATPTCVSCSATVPSAGAASFGTGMGRPAQYGPLTMVADDGTVVFRTPTALVPRDTNGKHDVYRYRDGDIALISSGTDAYDALLLGAANQTRDIFFATGDSLVTDDWDNGDQDVYNARVGGGFAPKVAVEAAPCSGEDCRGAAVGGLRGSGAGTTTFHGRGNLLAPVEKTAPATRIILVKGARTVRGTRGTVRVKVSGKGRVRSAGNGLRRTSTNAGKASTVRVPVRLSARAQRTLRRKGTVRATVQLRFTPASGAVRTVRTRMTFRRATAKAKSRATTVVAPNEGTAR